ncbi:MAG: hypothetical protein ACRCXT_10270 [Paraclostridium sp.]
MMKVLSIVFKPIELVQNFIIVVTATIVDALYDSLNGKRKG